MIRDGFKTAHDISAYSLVALTRGAVPLMEKSGGGAVMAMTYYGAEKAVEGYNLMGVAKASLEASVRYLAANLGPKNIRVNAICPGTIQSPSLDDRIATLAKSSGQSLESVRKAFIDRQPIGRLGAAREMANLALYLASDESSYTTGQIHIADGGFAL